MNANNSVMNEFLIQNEKRDAVHIETTQSHQRIIAQAGSFTLHYGKYINGQKILTNDVSIKNSIFFKNLYTIRIPYTIKRKLLHTLMLMNIHEFSLFPEEDKYFNYIKKKKQIENKEIKSLETCDVSV